MIIENKFRIISVDEYNYKFEIFRKSESTYLKKDTTPKEDVYKWIIQPGWYRTISGVVNAIKDYCIREQINLNSNLEDIKEYFANIELKIEVVNTSKKVKKEEE